MSYFAIAKDIGLPEIPRLSYISSYDPRKHNYRPAGLADSKIGGAPFRPRGAGWPMDKHGQAYNFVAQLNFEQVDRDRERLGIPPLLDGCLPNTGIIQFFLPFDDAYGMGGSTPQFFVANIPDSTVEADEPVFAWQPHRTSPLKWVTENPHPERLAPNKKLAEKGQYYSAFASSPEDTTTSILDNPEVPQALIPVAIEPMLQIPIPGRSSEPTEEQEVAWRERVGQSSPTKEFIGETTHQIGGVPQILQNDPRESGSPQRLLFQIDGVAPMLWIGDSGIMQFFVDPQDLARGDFSTIRMDWACY